MVDPNEMTRREYAALMDRCRDVERTSSICWTAAGVTAVVLLSWAIGAQDPGLMLPVIIATAVGLYSLLHGARNVRMISSYVEEYLENQTGGAQWFSRLARMRVSPGISMEWLATGIANAIVVLATVFAWVYAGTAAHGELMAGIETGLAVIFAFHSLVETSKLHQTDYSVFWRQMSNDRHEGNRSARAA